ncbi:MAG: ISAs1 family transposase [Pseudomonadota bacterium]
MQAAPELELTKDQGIDFLSHFSALEDPRQQGKVDYPLEEILLLVLCGVLAGADGWVEIQKFGEKKLDLLRRFRPFENRTPSHDQLGDIFSKLDPEQFQSCFIAWVSSLTGLSGDIVAIDGKTLRRSYQQGGRKGAIHMISAFSANQRLVLGQKNVSDKSNEITAIPELLDLLAIEGAIVTIDAMGCQRKIASKIIAKKADYVLALKGNQSTLHDDIKLYFEEQSACSFKDVKADVHKTIEKSHGRIETRTYHVIDDIAWLQERHNWPGLKSIIMVTSTREIDGEVTCETRYYIASLKLTAKRAAEAVRGHWSIENSHHWIMDMVFRDDECRIRKDNAPANFATIKHIASNLLRAAPGKESMRVKRRMAAWDEDFLASVLAS